MPASRVLCKGRRRRWRCRGAIRFEDIKSSELLIQYCKWLELFCFLHLLFEPILDFILLHFFQVLVVIVEVSGDALGVALREVLYDGKFIPTYSVVEGLPM